MKVLLISANTLTIPYPVYPLGLDYVADSIATDHRVKIADMNDIKDYDLLAKIINDFSPDIIGLSLRNIDNTDRRSPKDFIGGYRELVMVLRNHSKAPLILGGSGFTIFPDEFMKSLEADYGIIGEGERLPLLLSAIENKEDPSNITGVVTRDKNGLLPVPWDNSFTRSFDAHNSHVQFYLKEGGMLNLQTKRGCNFRCIYCTYPHIEGKKMRPVPPEEVAKTAIRLQDAGAKYLFITDSIFNSNYSQSVEVARAFMKAGVSVPWGAFLAPTNPPQDYYQIMADAGLKHVEFGTDSLSNDVLALYAKPFRVKHVLNAHKSAIDAGLYVLHYFLLGGPGEDDDSLNETFSNIDKLDKTVLFFFCGMRIYPHTALYDIAVKERQISKSQSIIEPVFYESRLISSNKIIHFVEEQMKERTNWIIGSVRDNTPEILSRMYARGHYGPLWEHLIQY
jgi:radical SAM superfamily enzyme YgiQ (UPF0313 family)